MKTKTLLLAGIAAFALASCGGMKSYKNEVKKETFLADLAKKTEQSEILSSTSPFSFVAESKSEYESTATYFKNGDTLYENKVTENKSSDMKYDSVRSIYQIKSSSEYCESDASSVEEEASDEYYVYQSDKSAYDIINMKAKTYSTVSSEEAEEYVSEIAFALVSTIVNGISSIVNTKDAKFYEDGNAFTVVIDVNEESKTMTKTGKSVYQLVINNDGVEFYFETESVSKELNVTEEIKEKSSFTFTRKNSVSLSYVSLSSYLKVE